MLNLKTVCLFIGQCESKRNRIYERTRFIRLKIFNLICQLFFLKKS